MNTIIIGVMALIVLVVILFIFTSKIRSTSETTQKTVTDYKGEKCEIPGTGRVCRPLSVCQSMAGLNYGQLDCGANICCSK